MVFYFIYRWLVWPLLFNAFHGLALFNSKIAQGLRLRARVDGRRPWSRSVPLKAPTVWIHCASGEFEYAKPVITRLKARAPHVQIVVSFFSPTYAEAIRKFAGVDFRVPLPWDTPNSLNDFIDSYRPSVLLVARTDVWPQMARVAKERGLKSVLFSATLTPNSGRTKGLGRWATRETLDHLDEIFAVTDEDVSAFRSLGLTHARVSRQGDTRYDQVLARLLNPKPVTQIASPCPLLVCGSTWPEDEEVLVPALARLKNEIIGVLVPHEPTESHVTELETKLRAQALTPIRYSTLNEETRIEPGSCVVVDRVGILAELYLQARYAFVGGSFKKTVHSVMEPLAAGCLTFVGPRHTNNREAVQFAQLPLDSSHTMVTKVESSEQLASSLHAYLQTGSEARSLIKAAVNERTGSSDGLVEWVLQQL